MAETDAAVDFCFLAFSFFVSEEDFRVFTVSLDIEVVKPCIPRYRHFAKQHDIISQSPSLIRKNVTLLVEIKSDT